MKGASCEARVPENNSLLAPRSYFLSKTLAGVASAVGYYAEWAVNAFAEPG